MNVFTKVDVLEDDWDSKSCFDIEFQQNTDIEKSGENGINKYFHSLSFKYRLTEERGGLSEKNQSVYFAYCLPYTYTDLLMDLRSVKFQLLDSSPNNDATITYIQSKD